MKNTKKLIISCLILFLTAIGCSDYIEFAEKEYQAEREYQLKQYNGDEEDENKSGFLIYHDYEEKQTLDTHKDNQLINGKKGSSFVKEKEHS